MTDYLEEALKGLDGLVRRLRRMGAAAPNGEEDVNNFLDIVEKTLNYPGKSRSIDRNRIGVYDTEFNINQNINGVYNWEGDGRGHVWESSPGDGGGRRETLRPAEPKESLTGRSGGQDRGSLPSVGPAAEWISGGERRPAAPAGWSTGGTGRAWRPAEEAGPGLPSASGEIRWAEQADRAFRRDSRRYDGGFSLY